YIKKGDNIGISGRLQIRKWEQDGKTSNFTEVIVNSFDFQDKKKQDKPTQNKVDNDPFSGSGTINIQDDDLPF
ncbi:MAG: single-stranded DNA-binding protein, partial [Bacillota bacterium]|nr:single-stranded DNA-binding protein [Bacillota bacterium]